MTTSQSTRIRYLHAKALSCRVSVVYYLSTVCIAPPQAEILLIITLPSSPHPWATTAQSAFFSLPNHCRTMLVRVKDPSSLGPIPYYGGVVLVSKSSITPLDPGGLAAAIVTTRTFRPKKFVTRYCYLAPFTSQMLSYLPKACTQTAKHLSLMTPQTALQLPRSPIWIRNWPLFQQLWVDNCLWAGVDICQGKVWGNVSTAITAIPKCLHSMSS